MLEGDSHALKRSAEVVVADYAILFADLVGYSKLMEQDELGTLEFIVDCSRLIEDASSRRGGELVQTTGDGYLVLFKNNSDAIDFGIELHQLVAKRQAGKKVKAQFRVGAHFGAVHRVDSMVHGHAVNVAARLEGVASAGTCVLSQSVVDHLKGKRKYNMDWIGTRPLKNITEDIQLYQTAPDDADISAAAQDRFRISLVGKPSLSSVKTDVRALQLSKSTALLVYLALSANMRERREKVISMLTDPEAVSNPKRSFSACQRHLQELLGQYASDLLIAEGAVIGLDELRFETDLDQILRELRQGDVPAELLETSNLTDKILAGYEVISPVYATWLSIVRNHWRTRILDALSAIIRSKPAADLAYRNAAQTILAMEPGNEAASIAIIRHHAHYDNRSAAMSEYARLTNYLKGTHGLEPSQRAQDAIAEICKTVENPVPEPSLSPAVPEGRLLRIVVDDFRQAQEEHNHIVRGFRSELIANLARFREWSVAETDASLMQKDRTFPVCHYAVLGNYKAGEVPHLEVHLKDMAAGKIIWSDVITLNLERWSEGQREVISRIAGHLETYISADRLSRALGNARYDSTSHDEWLRAERIFAQWSPDAAREAEAMLERIIEDDSSFAPAYSSLASFRNVRHVIQPGLKRGEKDAQIARFLAERAVELDPLDARNHLAVAWTAAMTGAFDRAAIHLDMAASLNPNNPATLVSCAMGFTFIGQAFRGETIVGHVLRIAPVLNEYQWCYIASVYFLAGRFAEALQAAQMSGNRIVDNQGWTAASLVQLGRMDEAREAFSRLIDDVRPVWAGEESPTAEAVFEWFADSYPLRNDADRELLANSLAPAMRGQ